MKSNFYFIILSVITSFFYSDGIFAQNYSGGEGNTGNPYQIATLIDLRYLSENAADWDKHFKQTANIDVTATNTWNVGNHDGDDGTTPEVAMGFISIGNEAIKIIGTYNGQNFKISNLKINRPNEEYLGLFGSVSNSNLSNINLIAINIIGFYHSGAVIGKAYDTSFVNNCKVSGNLFTFMV